VGERPQVLDEPREHARVVQHLGQPRVVARIDAVDESLEPP
jgi:hypothetical protein